MATLLGAIHSDDTPKPTSTKASSGSPPASLHTPTGLPVACSAQAGALHHGQQCRLPRAQQGRQRALHAVGGKRVLDRSFVPIDTKSITESNSSAMIAALGILTMMPTFADPSGRTFAANDFASSRVEPSAP